MVDEGKENLSLGGHVKVGLQRTLSTEELMLLNCGIGEDS